MKAQKGETLSLIECLALALLGLCLIEAGIIVNLHRHRSIQINMSRAASGLPRPDLKKDPYADVGFVHAWPSDNRSCCDAPDTICFQRT